MPPKGWKKRDGKPTPKAVSDETLSSTTDLVLRIHRVKEGSFAGLWQLSRELSPGIEKVLMDASTKESIIKIVGREIAKCH